MQNINNNKEFYLIRHGESLGNIGIDAGADPDLSPAGYAQVAECAEFMGKTCGSEAVIFSSPFKRCLRTSQAISGKLQVKVILEPLFQEFFAVEWLPINKIKLPSLKKIADENGFIQKMDYTDEQWWPEKNETATDLTIRIGMFKNYLLSGRVSAAKIVCVGHWASVAGMVSLMCPDINMEKVSNAGVTKILSDGHSFEAAFLNDVSFMSHKSQLQKS